MSAETPLKLTLEPAPEEVRRRRLPGWARIRRRVLEEYGYRCAACGDEGREGVPLHCHEVWEYDLDGARKPTPEEVEARRARDQAKADGDRHRRNLLAGMPDGVGEAWSVAQAVRANGRTGYIHVVAAPLKSALRRGEVFPLCRPYKPLSRVAPVLPGWPTCPSCDSLARERVARLAEEHEREVAYRERRAARLVGVRKLVGLVPLCATCHSVKHTLASTPLPRQRWREHRTPPPPLTPGERLQAELDRQADSRRRTWGDHREEDALRLHFYREEAAKPRGEQRFWSDDPEGWPQRYRRELEERGEQEMRRWLENLDRRSRRTPLGHFVEVNRHVPLDVLEAHIFEAQKLRGERSHAEWRTDFGEYGELFA